MQPLVSILVPAYNAEGTIALTLTSAVRQTWSQKEIIVVDDGSRDNTRAVAETFAADNVRVVSQKNQGASAARNAAFALSRGDYVQWLDADDLMSPNKIAAQLGSVSTGRSPDGPVRIVGPILPSAVPGEFQGNRPVV